jgi:hypothetical protein
MYHLLTATVQNDAVPAIRQYTHGLAGWPPSPTDLGILFARSCRLALFGKPLLRNCYLKVTCSAVVAKHRMYVTIYGSIAIYANHYIHVTMGLYGRNIAEFIR